MKRTLFFAALVAGVFMLFGVSLTASESETAQSDMTFFLTSRGPGDGANLGGLEGADAHCAMLAAEAGAADGLTWRAYLSTTGDGGVNAKDRIGGGPWHNANGVMVASGVADLHSDNNLLSKENSITEKGDVISGRGRRREPPRHHHRLHPGRDGGHGRRRHHLLQLDEQLLGRQRAGGPPRPGGRWRQPHVLERVPRLARLRAGGPSGHGRRRPLLLLRDAVGGARSTAAR